jgi:hypothetical protein
MRLVQVLLDKVMMAQQVQTLAVNLMVKVAVVEQVQQVL